MQVLYLRTKKTLLDLEFARRTSRFGLAASGKGSGKKGIALRRSRVLGLEEKERSSDGMR